MLVSIEDDLFELDEENLVKSFLIEKRETFKHQEYMYCPRYNGLCPTMPSRSKENWFAS